MVFLASTKEELRSVLNWLMEALAEIKLELKDNYQIFPVDARGIDFVGYVFFHNHIKIRKSIKLKIERLINKYLNNKITFDKFKKSISAYYGWLQYCNSKHYLEKICKQINLNLVAWLGEKSLISNFYNKSVRVIIIDKRFRYYKINVVYRNKSYTFKSTAKFWENYLYYKNFNIIIYGKRNTSNRKSFERSY